ncbi:MAG: hypothetical protein KDI88_15005 [Gammaproteobacteria bacterium]|nr:hypothetical protein [Gammaproteobacteria bacterium]
MTRETTTTLSYQDISVDQLDELLATEDLVVIDMRDTRTRQQGSLPGAQPHTDAVVHALIRRRKRDPAVLVYCYHGIQSRDLCRFLAQFGLSSIYNLNGGWRAWERHRKAARDERPGRAATRPFSP